MTKKELESLPWLRTEIEGLEERYAEAESRYLEETGFRGTKCALRDMERIGAELAERKKQERVISEWIGALDDPFIRQIIVHRIVCRRSWGEVAAKVHTTEFSVKKAYYRFMKRQEKV